MGMTRTKYAVPVATAISVMSSPMARLQPGSATA